MFVAVSNSHEITCKNVVMLVLKTKEIISQHRLTCPQRSLVFCSLFFRRKMKEGPKPTDMILFPESTLVKMIFQLTQVLLKICFLFCGGCHLVSFCPFRGHRRRIFNTQSQNWKNSGIASRTQIKCGVTSWPLYNRGWDPTQLPFGKLTWLAGKWTRIEDVFPIENWDFPFFMVVYQRVHGDFSKPL